MSCLTTITRLSPNTNTRYEALDVVRARVPFRVRLPDDDWDGTRVLRASQA